MQTIMSSFADPRHQWDDWPVLRWVAATPAAGAWRRLPRCLCSCPWEPDWRIKQDHREGRPFNDWCGWRNTVWVAEKVFLQTLNMTNRWKKTSEDVQAISAPKVIPKYSISCHAQKCQPASQPELFRRTSPASSPASLFQTLCRSQSTTSSHLQWKTKET